MEKGYVGSIANQGAQTVKAPVKVTVKSGDTKIKTGNDLRTGK